MTSLIPKRDGLRARLIRFVPAVFCLFVAAGLTHPSTANAQTGPVVALAFDENAGTTTADSSGSNNSGVLNGPSWTVGHSGSALSFDGTDDKVSLPSTLDIATLPLTVEAWIRPTSYSNWRVIFSKRNSYTAAGMRVDVGLWNSTGSVFVTTFTTTRTFSYTPPLNVWTHVAVVADSSGTRLYVNGALQQTLATITLGTGSGAAVNIGRTGDNDDPFAGAIDDVRVYKRALSLAEIQADMNNPVSAPPPDTTPPTAPSGLTATATSATQINLTWTAATDTVGVTGYRVERCQGAGCSNFAQVGTPTTTTFNDTGLTGSTSYSYRVRATDAAGNLGPYSNTASANTPAPPDTTPPTAPSGLTAAASSPTQIDLIWAAATDAVGVTGYRVERCQGAGCSNFIQVGTPTTTAFSDSGLTGSTSYSYRVRATDAAGNLGPYSNIASASTPAPPDTTPPSAPSGLTATASSPTQINLAWTAATDNVGVTGYMVERCEGAGCGNFVQIATPTATTFSDTGGLTASTGYSYRVRGTDAAGNLGNYSNIASTTTPAVPDTTPPTAPSGLTATASSATQINLTWTGSTDDVGVTGYRVERCQGAGCSNFTQVGTATPTTFSDSGLTGSTSYSYRVRATDAAGNLGPYSNIASTSTPAPPDTTPPTAPSSLSATAASTTQINLAWTASTDAVGVTGYMVERCQGAGCSNFTQVGTATPTTYSDGGLTASTSYSYRVRATDAAANLSPYSNTASATTQPPPVSGGPAVALAFDEGTGTTTIDASGSSNSGTLSGPVWVAGHSGTALSFDGIDDKVSLPSTLDLSSLPFTVEAWIRPSSYSNWRVIFSKRNSWSASGMRFDVGLANSTGNVYVTTAQTTVTSSYSPPTNTWTHLAVVADSSSTRVYVNGSLQQTLGVVTLGTGAAAVVNIGRTGDNDDPFAGLIDDLRFYKRALSLAEIQTDMNTPVSIPVPDIIPPTAPANLSASATSDTQISLAWVASTDNTAVALYHLERCQGERCSTFAQLGTTANLSFVDTGLTSSTSYSYRVRAADAAGNLGPYSEIASATTQAPDVTPPSAPFGLTASGVSGSQISLSWTSATDNVGVTGYRLERCQGAGCGNFAQISTFGPATSITDTGLNATTSYSYRLRATDANGNLGPYSNVATATTLADQINPIVIENQQQGTNAWQLGTFYGRTYADDTANQIKGYASATSVNKGDDISFHITVNPAQTFTIDVYRIGWYQGLGGRLMQHVGPIAGVQQPTCPTDASTGMISCNWSVSYTLQTQASWTSGVYLAVLKNAQNFYNYMVFVVRDDSRVGALLYQQPVTTYQAYNNYPDNDQTGKSLYEHNSYGANTLAGTTRAVKVSFDRPYSGTGAGQFLEVSEINFVRWAEKSGYDVTYSTDVDTHRDGFRLLNHRGFLSLPHDEYWSKQMYDAALAARDAGKHLAFFGANSIYWQIRFEPSSSGEPDRVVVCYKVSTLDPITDPAIKTIKFRDVNRAEQALVGVEFTDGPNSGTANYRVTNSSNWVWAGSGFTDGTIVPSIVWYEADRVVTNDPLPVAVSGTYVLLSHSPYAGSGGVSEHQNSSIYQALSGAWVFASGTMGWGWGLDDYYPGGSIDRVSPGIQRATKNILDRFMTTP